VKAKLIQGRQVEDIHLKAANPDNEVEIKQLSNLFRRVYGKSFPIDSVYDPQFWRTHIGTRFISVIAVRKGRIIAHLGAYPDSDEPRHVQLCFPLCDPAYSHLIPMLGKGAWSILQKQAQRQRWKMIYYFVFGNVPDMQQMADSIFFTKEVAICPDYLPASNLRPRGNKNVKGIRRTSNGSRTHISITQRIITAEENPPLKLFIPRHHRQMIECLYEPLGLKRTFMDRPKHLREAHALPAEARAVEKNYFSKTGVVHSFVHPSLLPGRPDDVEGLSANGNSQVYAFVNMEDPACPAFCEKLEDKGYQFCGILPLLKGRDSVVYYKASSTVLQQADRQFDEDFFYSPRAKMLASYTKDQDPQKALTLLDGVPFEETMQEINGKR